MELGEHRLHRPGAVLELCPQYSERPWETFRNLFRLLTLPVVCNAIEEQRLVNLRYTWFDESIGYVYLCSVQEDPLS